jgi:hypothetical protein
LPTTIQNPKNAAETWRTSVRAGISKKICKPSLLVDEREFVDCGSYILEADKS